MPDDDRTEHRLWQELERLSAAWDLAMISNDAGAIGRFMADDWVIVSASGVTARDDFLAVVASGDLTHETFRGEITSVRQYGDAAVVTGRVRNNGHYRASRSAPMNGPPTCLRDATTVGYVFTVTSRPFERRSYFFVLLLSIKGAHFPSGP